MQHFCKFLESSPIRIILANFANCCPFSASFAALMCLMLAHFECPASRLCRMLTSMRVNCSWLRLRQTSIVLFSIINNVLWLDSSKLSHTSLFSFEQFHSVSTCQTPQLYSFIVNRKHMIVQQRRRKRENIRVDEKFFMLCVSFFFFHIQKFLAPFYARLCCKIVARLSDNASQTGRAEHDMNESSRQTGVKFHRLDVQACEEHRTCNRCDFRYYIFLSDRQFPFSFFDFFCVAIIWEVSGYFSVRWIDQPLRNQSAECFWICVFFVGSLHNVSGFTTSTHNIWRSFEKQWEDKCQWNQYMKFLICQYWISLSG